MVKVSPAVFQLLGSELHEQCLAKLWPVEDKPTDRVKRSGWTHVASYAGRQSAELHVPPEARAAVQKPLLIAFCQHVLEKRFARRRRDKAQEPLATHILERRWPETQRQVKALIAELEPRKFVRVFQGPAELLHDQGQKKNEIHIWVPREWPVRVSDPRAHRQSVVIDRQHGLDVCVRGLWGHLRIERKRPVSAKLAKTAKQEVSLPQKRLTPNVGSGI